MVTRERAAAGWFPSLRLCRDRAKVALVLAISLLSPAVFAQEKVSATAGEEVSLLKDSKEPIEAAKPTDGDVTVKATGEGDAKRYELAYKAPAKALDRPVTITYKVGSGAGVKEEKVEVTVTQPPLTDVRTVLPGSDSVLLESKDVLKLDKQPSIGAAVVRSVGDPKTYQLAYVAPSNVTNDRTELLYRANGKPARFEMVVSSNPWGTGYEAAFKILFSAFVLAALIEWALAVVFNWRWYLLIFDAKGTKTIVTFIVSWLVVWGFDIDVVRELINVLRNASHPSSPATWVLSALVVAGGSAGVNSLMVALGLRSVRTAESLQDRPPPTVAWLSFQAYSGSASVKTVQVLIKSGAETEFSHLTELHDIRRSRWALRNIFFLDKSRYPSYGGITWQPGVRFEVLFKGHDDKGNPILNCEAKRGPYQPVPGALIDVIVTLP